MSEINSIANGTYVIGQTSATNFVAGPGIKIDEPSAGTVRIGNDETVLWSGNLSAVNDAKLTATDAPSAYNTVKFIFSPYNDGLRSPTELYFSGCDKEFDLCPIGFMGTSIRLNHLRLNFDSNNVGTFSETVQYYISTGTNVSSTDRPALLQIIGINRKEV